jgi:hypothetical protein
VLEFMTGMSTNTRVRSQLSILLAAASAGMIFLFSTHADTPLWHLNHEPRKPNRALQYVVTNLRAAAHLISFRLSGATEIKAADDKDIVAVCFFGQVKQFDHVASSIQKHIFNLLESENFAIEIYAHTYNQTSFTNPRNRENNTSIDPTSLGKYFSVNVSYNVSVIFDDLAAADSSFDLKQLLKYGDPWPENPIISARNMVRQLYSLRRVSQLWAPYAHRYKYCIYLRPDLHFTADLDMNRTRPRLDNGTISTPDFAQFGGLNDRFAIGTPAVMQIYGSRADQLLDYVLRLKRKPHAEAFLLHAMRSRGIRNIDSSVRFKRMRAGGSLQ